MIPKCCIIAKPSPPKKPRAAHWERPAGLEGSCQCLEGCRDGQAEGLARLPEHVACTIGLDRFVVGVVARAARREHGARNQLRRAATLLTPTDNAVAVGRVAQGRPVTRPARPARPPWQERLL